MSYQSTTIIGNPAADPEIQHSASGAKYARVSVAVNKNWTGNDGKKQEKTTWYKCVFFRESLVNVAENWIKKGKEVMLIGEVDSSGWTDKDGNARSSLELVVQQITLLSNGGGNGNGGNAGSGSGDGQQGASFDPEIPF